MGTKEYLMWLGDNDRIAVRIVVGRRGVEDYSLQYECRWGDTDVWEAVRRYDCSHQASHVHAMRPGGDDRKTFMPGLSVKDGLAIARQELVGRWPQFRAEYEAALKKSRGRTGS